MAVILAATCLAAGALVAAAAAAVMGWRSTRQSTETLAALETRVTQLTAGIALLTDTTEVGLRDVATEIGRLAAPTVTTPARPRARAVTQRRITGAAKRGRSVQEIAALEDVSEGEVRLRLNIDKQSKGQAHAAVR
jgi:hypothetical protein